MRALTVRAILAGALLLTPLGAATVSANHIDAGTRIQVIHNAATVATYNGTTAAGGCLGTSCRVEVRITAKADYNRFLKWCGTDHFTLTISAGATQRSLPCLGGSGWSINTTAFLLPVNATHSAPVGVLIVATR